MSIIHVIVDRSGN